MPSPSDPAPDADPRKLVVVLHDLAWLLPRTVDVEASRTADLRSLPRAELEVMRLLARRPGLTVGEVADELGLQPTNASASVRVLVARGLLRRVPDDRDGRVVRLHPTAAALRERDDRERAWTEALARRLRELPAADRRRLLACGPALGQLAELLAQADRGQAPAAAEPAVRGRRRPPSHSR